MTERYDGYGNSIKRVMNNRDHEPGLLGVVADIVKVDKEYEIAVETALGGSIQNIVTDNEETAKRMIQFLKKNKFPDLKDLEDMPIVTIERHRDNQAVHIEASMEDLFDKVTNQNFVPVVDDNQVFIGIVTRKDVLVYLQKKLNERQ